MPRPARSEMNRFSSIHSLQEPLLPRPGPLGHPMRPSWAPGGPAPPPPYARGPPMGPHGRSMSHNPDARMSISFNQGGVGGPGGPPGGPPRGPQRPHSMF